MPRILILVALVCAVGITAPLAGHGERPAPMPRADEVRALWVARTTPTSPSTIRRMVQSASDNGFNTLPVQVRARGDAYFAHGTEPRAASLADQPAWFDPRQVTLTEARRAGLQVHARICVNPVASVSDLPRDRRHLVYQHPEWLMVPRALAKELRGLDARSPQYLDRIVRALRQQPADVEGLYASAILSQSADYVAMIVADIASRYPIDGIHLDYVRYPTDYSPTALAQFAAETSRTLSSAEVAALRRRESDDPYAWTDTFSEQWREFRRARLTTLVDRLRAALKGARPQALLMAAVVPDPADAAARRLQDWPRWLADGALDIACPMAYAGDVAGITAQLGLVRQAVGPRPFWAGIGAYRLSSAQTIEGIRAARRLGAAGIVLFSYDSLVNGSSDGRSLTEIGRAAFGRPSS